MYGIQSAWCMVWKLCKHTSHLSNTIHNTKKKYQLCYHFTLCISHEIIKLMGESNSVILKPCSVFLTSFLCKILSHNICPKYDKCDFQSYMLAQFLDKTSVVLLVERLEKCTQNKTYSSTHSSYPTKRASHCNVQNCMPFCCGKIDIICSWVPFLSNNKTTRIWLFKPHEVCCCLLLSNLRFENICTMYIWFNSMYLLLKGCKEN